MTAPIPNARRGNPNFLNKSTNQDDYVVAAFDLYESELEKLKALCPLGADIGQFVEKALRAYLKRPESVWSPVMDLSGTRTRVFARVNRELLSRAIDLCIDLCT